MTAHIDMTDALFRQSVVGAGEVAALFDASPWLTRFELYHRKLGTIGVPDFNAVADGTPENERIWWGVKLEPVVIEAACERWGYEPLDTPKRFDNGAGLGGHPDKLVRCPERGPGILEVKTADWLVAKKWGDEPPTNYLVQSQTYQGLAGVTWGDVIVLVGGNELRRYRYDFRPTLYAEIERRVAAFWQDVRSGTAPPVDYARDGATLIDVIGVPDDTVADLRDDLDAEQDAMDYAAARERRYAAEADEATAKARLIERIGAAGTALLPSFRVNCGEAKGSPGKLITQEMVGTYVGARKGWRRFDLKSMEKK